MAVLLASTFRAIPGRNKEFLADIAEAKKHHERLGGSVRTWSATIAGEASNNVVYGIEHADIVAYANFSQKVAADADFQAFTQKIGANPSGTRVSTSLLTEIE